MLVHKLFHRAQKVIVVPKEDKKKGKKSKSDAENSAAEDKKKPEKKEKVRKKVKLDMHLQQIMVDANEPYVWIYDPIPLKTWIIGFAMVIGAILVCLFPLWPRVVRTYVYYLSVAAAGFLFFIIGLAVLRFIVFCIVWGLTMGKHHFWILPNLTEDVGFWASFWPLYLHEYGGTTDSSESKESSPSKKKKSPEKEPLLDDKEEDKEEGSSVDEDSASAANPNDHYGTNSSENGFEILDTQDLDVESSHPKSS
jgi:translocation protein SEC62